MRKFFGKLILTIAFLLSVATLVAYYTSYINPQDAKALAFSGFAFPYLWVLTLVFMVLMIIASHLRATIITILSLILTWNGFSRVVNIGPSTSSEQGEHKIKILTFNVQCLNFNQSIAQSTITDIIEYILEQDADIVCLQEMKFSKGINKAGYKNLFEMFPSYPYIVSDEEVKKLPAHSTGQVTLSRYPLKYIKYEDFSSSTNRTVLTTDINVKGTTIRVFNCHLQSIRLSEEQITAVSEASHAELGDKTKENLKTTYHKMSEAFILRAQQSHDIVSKVDETKGNIIVCGDFNDTPISYCYNTISRNLIDAFSEVGEGMSNTYNGKLPPLRIDYILHSKNMTSSTYSVDEVNLSDHFPLHSIITY